MNFACSKGAAKQDDCYIRERQVKSALHYSLPKLRFSATQGPEALLAAFVQASWRWLA